MKKKKKSQKIEKEEGEDKKQLTERFSERGGVGVHGKKKGKKIKIQNNIKN